jgi:hypothetical protein
VTIDGVEVPAAAIGVKRPVDPGKHVVRATAPGALPSELTITILEGQVQTTPLELKPDPDASRAAPPPVAPPPVAPPPVAPPPATASPPTVPPPPQGTSTQRVLGFVSLGVGGAGLVVGAIGGGLALAKHASLVDQCPGGSCYPSQKSALEADVDAYHTLGTLSTAGFVVGGAGVVTGVILLLTSPKAPPASAASIRPLIGLGTLGAEGRF